MALPFSNSHCTQLIASFPEGTSRHQPAGTTLLSLRSTMDLDSSCSVLQLEELLTVTALLPLLLTYSCTIYEWLSCPCSTSLNLTMPGASNSFANCKASTSEGLGLVASGVKIALTANKRPSCIRRHLQNVVSVPLFLNSKVSSEPPTFQRIRSLPQSQEIFPPA